MTTELKEQRTAVLKRVPPGDRWTFANPAKGTQVFQSLTDALEGWYQLTDETQFFMDARKGTVEVVSTIEVEVPQKRFSLYGED